MGAMILFVFIAADATPQAAKEFKRLDGTWQVVKEERDGGAVGKDTFVATTVRFTAEKPKDADRRCDLYYAALDPKADPPRLTATVTGGEIKGERILVVYRLDGDVLVMRLAYGAKTFPKGFETREGDNTFVLHLRRLKP